MSKTKSIPTPTKRVDVTLLRDHVHQGSAHKAGDVLSVAVTLLPWLRAQGVIAEESK